MGGTSLLEERVICLIDVDGRDGDSALFNCDDITFFVGSVLWGMSADPEVRLSSWVFSFEDALGVVNVAKLGPTNFHRVGSLGVGGKVDVEESVCREGGLL